MSINEAFAVHRLTPEGLAKAETLAVAFSDLLQSMVNLGVNGRELALVTTKLQEASFFAKRSIAMDKSNQL